MAESSTIIICVMRTTARGSQVRVGVAGVVVELMGGEVLPDRAYHRGEAEASSASLRSETAVE
jgi:ribosomal protein S3